MEISSDLFVMDGQRGLQGTYERLVDVCHGTRIRIKYRSND